MEAIGVVSLWVGSASSEDAFLRALHATFSEDGDFVGSPFSLGFEIGYYDDVEREAAYFAEAPRSLGEMLAGTSYAEVTRPRFQALGKGLETGDNCMVLLFNRSCHGVSTRWIGAGVTLHFIGSVSYE